MITGSVTAHLEATVPLTVEGRDGRTHEIVAVIDTGFDGSLSLPPSLISTLGLPWRRRGRVLLADGSETVCDIFEGTLIWDRARRRLPVDAAETVPLIGMSLLHGYALRIEVVAGGGVAITPLR
jgi:clan AA aspartic protease